MRGRLWRVGWWAVPALVLAGLGLTWLRPEPPAPAMVEVPPPPPAPPAAIVERGPIAAPAPPPSARPEPATPPSEPARSAAKISPGVAPSPGARPRGAVTLEALAPLAPAGLAAAAESSPSPTNEERSLRLLPRALGSPETLAGRSLLKRLEAGEAPRVHLIWPIAPAERDAIHDILTRCLGVRTGIRDSTGRVFLGEGPKGRRWIPAPGRFSGWVRDTGPEAVPGPAERAALDIVRRHHNGKVSGEEALIFPRHADESLLGGLRSLAGEAFDRTSDISARYRLDGRDLLVTGIEMDGRPLPGRLVFPACNG